jgi:hypothetical protein
VSRPPEHGIHTLAADLAVVKLPRRVRERPSLRVRRAVERLQRQLDEKPIEAVRDGINDTVSRLTVASQTAEEKIQHYLDTGQTDRALSVGRLAYWLGNRLDRNREMLVQLEQRRDADRLPSLSEYLASRTTASPAVAAPATEPQPAVSADAAEATADGQEPT